MRQSLWTPIQNPNSRCAESESLLINSWSQLSEHPLGWISDHYHNKYGAKPNLTRRKDLHSSGFSLPSSYPGVQVKSEYVAIPGCSFHFPMKHTGVSPLVTPSSLHPGEHYLCISWGTPPQWNDPLGSTVPCDVPASGVGVFVYKSGCGYHNKPKHPTN